MLFNGIAFLVFLPIVMVLYFATSGRIRLWVCLISSYVFYGWWDWRFLGLIMLSTLIDYVSGLFLANMPDGRRRKRWLIVSMVANLGLLGFFKYFNFFVDSMVTLLTSCGVTTNLGSLYIILPVGISFYTFQTMSYTIDVYRREIPAERSLLRFATFVAFFPQLVAGPIVRAGLFLPQLYEDHRFSWERFVDGVALMLWGYFLKVGVADPLSQVVDPVFASPHAVSGLTLIFTVVIYAFQIYGDFAGYSSIAVGLARIMGYDFGVNFNRPYFSSSFSEFWQRWHVSLSSWLRDYLYIPLGGNRRGKLRTDVNLMSTMLLGGLWHGANWRFVAWGGLQGSFLIAQRLFGPIYNKGIRLLRLPQVLSKIFLVALVFALTCFALIFIRAQTFREAYYVISRILTTTDFSWSSVELRLQIIKAMFLIAVLWTAELISFRYDLKGYILSKPWLAVVSGASLLWFIALFGRFASDAFIYFQF